ncbi:MAG: acylphosphatase [Nitrospirae bacterium]|nr:acylphosphatase [Nitrospirota bacterium]
MIRRIHLSITGRVQGVCYRAFTKHNAELLGLNGWVRNMPDGAVESLAEGEEDLLERLVELCRQGPQASVVTAVTVVADNSTEVLNGFQIRY